MQRHSPSRRAPASLTQKAIGLIVGRQRRPAQLIAIEVREPLPGSLDLFLGGVGAAARTRHRNGRRRRRRRRTLRRLRLDAHFLHVGGRRLILMFAFVYRCALRRWGRGRDSAGRRGGRRCWLCDYFGGPAKAMRVPIQRPAIQYLAGRRHHALPIREKHQLGGRLAGAGLCALARKVQGRHGAQRHCEPPGLVADSSPPRETRTSNRSCTRATRSAARPTR